MTTLDHRILIPSPPHGVWDYVSNLENNPEWQVDCEGIVFLSQKRKGIGTRWRQRATTRQEFVFEVSTWYDGLGYEYVLIDGGPYTEVRGRIRLQEISEGTIVQWTFTYELGGGVLGGIRNALTTERRQDSVMVNSLKTLWKQGRRMGTLTNYQPRSMMRDGPGDPLSRAAYNSQHPATFSPVAGNPSVPSSPVISEPPVSDEDTRPRPIVTEPEPSAPPKPEEDLARFAPPNDTAAQTDLLPVRIDADQTEPAAPPLFRPYQLETPTLGPPTAASPTGEDDKPPEVTPQAEPAPASIPSTENVPPVVPPNTDTSEMSIWEVFGIPSPTDTQRMRAIAAAQEAEAEYEAEEQAAAAHADAPQVEPVSPVITPEPTQPSRTTVEYATNTTQTSRGRIGLRAKHRNTLLKLRQPE